MSGNSGVRRYSGPPLPQPTASDGGQRAPSVASAPPVSAPTTVGEVAQNPAGSLPSKGWKDLPPELRDLVFDNLHGASSTGWDRKKLSTTFGIPLQDLSAKSKLQVATEVKHGLFETAEKLDLHPCAILANIANPQERLTKLAATLGRLEGEELQEKLDMFCAERREGERRCVHPALGFQGEDAVHASQLLNAPLHVLHDEMATAETRGAAIKEIKDFMGQCGRPAGEALLTAWKQRAGRLSENNLAVLQHYVVTVFRHERHSRVILKRIVDEMADVGPGKDFQQAASIFKREPGRPDEISTAFSRNRPARNQRAQERGLNKTDREKANKLLSAPLSLLSKLDKDPSRDPAQMLKDQKEALKKIKSAIRKMGEPSQAAAREVMLVGLSERLRELGSDELKLEAVQFLRIHWESLLMDEHRTVGVSRNGGADHQKRIFDNMLGLVSGMDGMPSASIRSRLLSELSKVPNTSSELTPNPVAHGGREALLHELTESFVSFKKGKRKAIEVVGKGIRSTTTTEAVTRPHPWLPYNRMTDFKTKPDIASATQVQLLGRMLGVAGEIDSVETQRQILVELSKTMNAKDLLDANSKKELVILLGKSIPNFHFSRLDSGRNMQHKAYKLFRGLIQQKYTEVSSYGYVRGPESAIHVRNPTPFSDRDIADIIAAVADSLPEQSTASRPGTRNHTELTRFPRTSNRMWAMAGSPLTLALAPVTPPRPPIRDSLVNNMLGALEDYQSKPPYGKLDAARDRIPAWSSLLGNSPSLHEEHRHKIVDRFLATVSVRDEEINWARKEIYKGIAQDHANLAREIAALDQQANLEIGKLRETDPLAITTWLQSLDRQQQEKLLLPLKKQYPALPPYLDRSQQALQYRILPPGPLPAERSEELVERVKARRDELVAGLQERAAEDAMDRLIRDYAVRHELDPVHFLTDPEARIDGMRIEEFKEATRPAMMQVVRLHADMHERLAKFDAPIDEQIRVLRSARQKKGRFNVVGRQNDTQKIRQLEKRKAAERSRVNEEAAQALAAIPFPHLQRYEADFTPAFAALAEMLPALEKPELRDRAMKSLSRHNASVPEDSRISLPERETGTSVDAAAGRA